MKVLSNTEREFLKNPNKFSPGYQRVMKHRIVNKVTDFLEEMHFIVTASDEKFREVKILNESVSKLETRIDRYKTADLINHLKALPSFTLKAKKSIFGDKAEVYEGWIFPPHPVPLTIIKLVCPECHKMKGYPKSQKFDLWLKNTGTFFDIMHGPTIQRSRKPTP